jgi:hypothetical protein
METERQHPTARITSFVEPRLAERVAALAEKDERSVSETVRRLLRQALESKRG